VIEPETVEDGDEVTVGESDGEGVREEDEVTDNDTVVD